MAARRIKVQQGEDLSDATKEKVIALLEADKPITKKAACEILNITYNTTRLKNIIEEYKEDKEFRKNMRKKMRNQPIDTLTAKQIVSGYLSGNSLQSLSDESYRSINVIKNILSKYHIPIRNRSVDYFHPVFIENDEAIKTNYEIGDLVYSARYDTPATIMSCNDTVKYGMVYKLQIHGDKRRQVNQPYYELADLRKVQNELKVVLSDLDKETVNHLIVEALKNQKFQENKR